MVEKKGSAKQGKIAIVRIRGGINLSPQISMTLRLLNLHKQNHCVILTQTESSIGMVKKVKDYVTWGEIDEKVLDNLREKRLEMFNDKDGQKKEKKFFRLQPPLKGFDRKGIKIPFAKGGALGYRKNKINDLILRML